MFTKVKTDSKSLVLVPNGPTVPSFEGGSKNEVVLLVPNGRNMVYYNDDDLQYKRQ